MNDKIGEKIKQVEKNCGEALVLMSAIYADDSEFAFFFDEVETYPEQSIGFFIEPDKIVTTISSIAGASVVVAINAELLRKPEIREKIESFDEQDKLQIPEEVAYPIKGVAAFDAKNNILILKTSETGTPLQLGNSDDLKLGDTVFTLGFGEDIEHKCKSGTIQCRYNKDRWFQMQTDYAPGDGGGPVLNTNNEVVGIMTYGTASHVEDSNSTIASFIPSNILKELTKNMDDLIDLERWQKFGRIRAYALEISADNSAETMSVFEAIEAYNSALKLNPDLVEIYNKRGTIKSHFGHCESAKKDFDKMIKINPHNIFSYNNRASCKFRLEDYEGAFEDLEKALELNPKYITGYANRGNLKMQLTEFKISDGEFEEAQRYCNEAKEDFTKALTLMHENPDQRKMLNENMQYLKELNSKINRRKRPSSIIIEF